MAKSERGSIPTRNSIPRHVNREVEKPTPTQTPTKSIPKTLHTAKVMALVRTEAKNRATMAGKINDCGGSPAADSGRNMYAPNSNPTKYSRTIEFFMVFVCFLLLFGKVLARCFQGSCMS